MRVRASFEHAAVSFLGLVFTVSSHSSVAHADESLTLRQSWSGHIDFFATGQPMAIDGPDSGTQVDQLVHPATVVISQADVPALTTVLAAYLYWGGSIDNDDCQGATIDSTVTFTPPSGTTAPVTADVCYCSDAGATSYDIQLCRVEITTLVSPLVGSYSVDDFSAKIENGATNNASFSLVWVYRDQGQTPRRVGLYDGLQTLWASGQQTAQITLGGLDVDNPAEGDLTWYVLEGDVGGTGNEQVDVAGVPGGLGITLSDGFNPANNPMNHTINTTNPVQTNSIGVDIDQFDIASALTPGDTAVDMTYQASQDKWWLAYNIVGVNVHEAAFGAASTKTWELHQDADNSGTPSAGDTVRYTIHLTNTGTAPGEVSLSDPIPSEASSWQLVDAGGGTDNSTTTTLSISAIAIGVGLAEDVVFDVVVANVPNQTVMSNTAHFDATPDGDQGNILAPDVLITDGTGGAGGVGGSSGVGGGVGATGTGAGSAVGGTGGVGGASTAGASGVGGPQGSGGGVDEDSGCGCRVLDEPSGPARAPWWLLTVIAAAGLMGRRRHRGPSPRAGRPASGDAPHRSG